MDVGESIRGYLAANVGVAALVGTRIYHDVIPQGVDPRATPCIVCAVTSTTAFQKLRGLVGTNAARIQFDCRAGVRTAATAIANAVTAALQVLQASIASVNGPVAVGDVQIHEVDLQSGDRWDALPPPDGSDEWIRTTAQDCKVFFTG